MSQCYISLLQFFKIWPSRKILNNILSKVCGGVADTDLGEILKCSGEFIMYIQ